MCQAGSDRSSLYPLLSLNLPLTKMTLPLAPSSARIQTIFNRIAPVYDEFNDWLSLGQHRVWKMMALKWSEARPGDTCLDLCCGSGDLAALLAERAGKAGRVFGVDFSPALLELAEERNSRQSVITWVEADVLNLPFPDNYVDAATMGYGLRNVIDIPRCLQEVHRVLGPGAKAAILDFHRPSNPALRAFQQWYLDTMVVPLAKAKGLYDEYAYISPSLERFPTGETQEALAREAGFESATHYAIAGDMMGILVVAKGRDSTNNNEFV